MSGEHERVARRGVGAAASHSSGGAIGGGSGDTSIGAAAARAQHWPDIARMWDQVGPPLRPSAEDVAFFADVVRRAAAVQSTLRALMLGVTPEIYGLPWPHTANVLAVDRTRGMIDVVWPGPRDRVICGDWTALPLAAASRDVAFCDGGLHLLSHPGGQQAFVGELSRVLAPGGRCVLRLFVPPMRHESPDAVLDDLLAGRIANLNVLKLRLGMALQENPTSGVELRRVWDALHRVAPDLAQLADRLAWPLEHLIAIDTYRDSPARYSFVDADAAHDLFCRDPGGFLLESTYVPTYTLGERCPTLVLRRHHGA